MNIIELAKEAGFPTMTEYGYESLERFAALVRAGVLADQFPDATKMVAEHVKQEPVAYWSNDEQNIVVRYDLIKDQHLLFDYLPLYAAPVDTKAIRAEALEEAAKVCEANKNYRGLGVITIIAAAIRGLK